MRLLILGSQIHTPHLAPHFCNHLPQVAQLFVTILCTLIDEQKSVSRNMQEDRNLSAYSINFTLWISTTDWLIVLKCLSPCQRNRPPAEKNPSKNIPLNKGTPMHSCPLLYKKENSNVIWKWGVSHLYPCSTCQVQVQRAFRGLNHQTPLRISNRI
jgi:hypothetical protein